jgi:hypothetical protein
MEVLVAVVVLELVPQAEEALEVLAAAGGHRRLFTVEQGGSVVVAADTQGVMVLAQVDLVLPEEHLFQ